MSKIKFPHLPLFYIRECSEPFSEFSRDDGDRMFSLVFVLFVGSRDTNKVHQEELKKKRSIQSFTLS